MYKGKTAKEWYEESEKQKKRADFYKNKRKEVADERNLYQKALESIRAIINKVLGSK